MKLHRISFALLTTLALSACSFAPDYKRPDLPMPQEYTVAATTDSIPMDWWTLFGDTTLNALVNEALNANQDLAAAAARVEQARAIAGVAKAQLYPVVGVQGTGSRTQIPDNQFSTAAGRENPFNSYNLLGTISYELDFWGKLRNANKAGREAMLASEEGRRNVELAVVSDVASTYFDLLAADRQLSVSRGTLASRQEAVRLQQLRYDAGSISGLDLAQAQAELFATQATVPVLERTVRQTELQLGVLLGRIGGSVARGDSIEMVHTPEVPVGLPSELIARRPDILAAEHVMMGSNANIGVARAAYLPSISLTGYGGWSSNELSQLITKDTDIWQASVPVFQTIFAPGKTKRQVDLAWGRYRETLADYIKSVQVAFAEVEDALTARRTSTQARVAEDGEVAARTKALELAQIRYDAGDSSYIEVLDAQRQLFQAQLLQAAAQRGELNSAVLVFKALGGGW